MMYLSLEEGGECCQGGAALQKEEADDEDARLHPAKDPLELGENEPAE